MRHNKKAFTLVELSVVIVIISIMLSTVLVSRSLITSAKINKIAEEYRMFSGIFLTFPDVYNCIPGDCSSTQIPDLASLLPGAALTLCTTTNTTVGASYFVANTGKIESALKRTCAFYEVFGTMSQVLAFTESSLTANHLVNAKAGRNIPFAKFSKSGAWDLRTVSNSGVTTAEGGYAYTLPRSVSNALTTTLKAWDGQIELVLRDAGGTVPTTAANVATNDITSASSGAVGAAVSPSFAQKLDLKYDDGLAHGGSIVAGKTFGASGLLTATTACTNGGDENTATNISSTVGYLSSDSVNNGCLVAFLIQIPNS